MRNLIAILLAMTFVCCKQQPSPPSLSQSMFKDSVVGEYLAMIDSLEFYDTLSKDFRILKAYIKNDTAFFTRLKKDMEQSRKDVVFYNNWGSCVTQKRLSDLQVDQAYRFKHWEAFCFFSQNITVTIKDSIVSLHYIENSDSPDGQSFMLFNQKGDTIKINPYCTIVKEFDKTLSIKDWNALESKVRETDYWGMKERGGGGLDGSVWQIDAFVEHKFAGWTEKSSHSVWRHSVFSKDFKELGLFILSLSGEKTMCREIY